MHIPISNELVKQVYFYCVNNNPDGVYPNEVDLLEFAEKFAEVIASDIAKAEHSRCVRIVGALNRDVGVALNNQSPPEKGTNEDWSTHVQRISHLERHITDDLNNKKYNQARERLLEIEHHCRQARSWIDAQ
jgi:hypothetical protein